MKSRYQTLLKLSLVAVFVAVGATATARAQDPRIQTAKLDYLSAKASETVDVNIDERVMQLTARFLSSKDPEEASVKQLVNGLKGIYVKSFQFEKEDEYSQADLESIRSQLKDAAWNKIVNVNSKREGSVEVYLMSNGSQISGLAVLATDPKEITVVNIIGPIDLEKLTKLEGQFGVPDLGIEVSKPKRKN